MQEIMEMSPETAIHSNRSGQENRVSNIRCNTIKEDEELDAKGVEVNTNINRSSNNDRISNNARNSNRSSVSANRASLVFLDRATTFNDVDPVTVVVGKIKFYSPPTQRQKWGESDVLSSGVDWGDLFFDLFYVAAAYNAGNILIEDPNMYGILYFAATFLTVQDIWFSKTSKDARYLYDTNDVIHNLRSVVNLIILSTMVLNMRSVSEMSNTSIEDMFIFCLFGTIHKLVSISDGLELYFFATGQKLVIQNEAKRLIVRHVLSGIFFFIATVITARSFFFVEEAALDDYDYTYDDDYHRFLAASVTAEVADTHDHLTTTKDSHGYDNNSNSTYEPNHSTYDDDHSYNRIPDMSAHVPIALCMAAHVSVWAGNLVSLVACFPKDDNYKLFMVPLNIDFVIHRNGEWIMLMLGEVVLSILTVTSTEDTSTYLLTLFSGVFTIILLQYLHFSSQPYLVDNHALSRDRVAGFFWLAINQIYSLSIIALSSSYSLFVLELETDIGPKKQYAANLFSASLGTLCLCIDLMTFCHIGLDGLKVKFGLHPHADGTTRTHGVLLLLIKFGLIIFFYTLSTWVTRADAIALIGFFGVFFRLIIGKSKVFLKKVFKWRMASTERAYGS